MLVTEVNLTANTMPQAEVVPITCKWKVVVRNDQVVIIEAKNTEARTLFSDLRSSSRHRRSFAAQSAAQDDNREFQGVIPRLRSG